MIKLKIISVLCLFSAASSINSEECIPSGVEVSWIKLILCTVIYKKFFLQCNLKGDDINCCNPKERCVMKEKIVNGTSGFICSLPGNYLIFFLIYSKAY